MQATFLLGPAGSGKTHRCLAEIRAGLLESPEGPPLVLLAPKQATFQLERQLLDDSLWPRLQPLPGYTRLQILSFERLAEFVLAELSPSQPKLLEEEGRVMVLRALLARKQTCLRIFRATARLPGFALQLSLLLRELQRHQHSPDKVLEVTDKIDLASGLGGKLHDLALLLRAYTDWLNEHQLQDADSLLDLATEALRSESTTAHRPSAIRFGGLWLDGFAEMTPQELDFLATLVPMCERATLAFCLESEPQMEYPWLSTWSTVGRTFRNCRRRLASLPGCRVEVQVLQRRPDGGRFTDNPVLAHLEKHWGNPQHFSRGTSCESSRPEGTASAAQLEFGLFANPAAGRRVPSDGWGDCLRVATCANPEAESVLAAREILRHVHAGGRYRECAVLLRSLEDYHDPLRRVFRRYDIPFFLDRREPVAYHPLAELTRYALRTVAFGWEQDDWFGALKTGLVPVEPDSVDRLENEALARGWRGETWHQRLRMADDEALEIRLEQLRQRAVPPFQQLRDRLTASPGTLQCTGSKLAAALREFWNDLDVARTLGEWSGAGPNPSPGGHRPLLVHQTVWDQMQAWLGNLDLAFPNESLPLCEWLPILEAGLGGMSVGVVPPALDQVLIGTIDRSRHPELQLAIVLGLNESVFPAVPTLTGLLTRVDRAQLAANGFALGLDQRLQLGREPYYGYVAFTRPAKRLVVTCAERDCADTPLNRSLFIGHLQRLFPGLEPEPVPADTHWRQAEHSSELVAPLLAGLAPGKSCPLADALPAIAIKFLEALPLFGPPLQKQRLLAASGTPPRLPAPLAEKLYGRELRTSVSALEDFAACPFKFFVARGLRGEERQEFEADPRARGDFQHRILERFHRDLETAGKRWRDVSPAEARELVARIGEELLPTHRDGLFLADDGKRFVGRVLIAATQKVVETLVAWMPQYDFDPSRVEVTFGLDEQGLPPWRIELAGGHGLVLRGRIDRIDLCRPEGIGQILAVVIDYKSRSRSLDTVKLQNGLELQLLSYLGAIQHLADGAGTPRMPELVPAGVFYVGLNLKRDSVRTRTDARANSGKAIRRGFQHSGRFNARYLGHLDNRDEPKGDQFRYAINNNGSFAKGRTDALDAAAFQRLLSDLETHLRRICEAIFDGDASVAPFRKRSETACDFCAFRSVCRFDPWAQPYRVLRPAQGPAEAHEPADWREAP